MGLTIDRVEGLKREALGAVAHAWNQRDIAYGVATGAQRYPERLGRDLDVLVAGSDRKAALRIALDVLAGLGWTPILSQMAWGEVWRISAIRLDPRPL